ncbi:MAG: hypothetical protein ACE5FC_09080, partial [Myxococcota bacterium]
MRARAGRAPAILAALAGALCLTAFMPRGAGTIGTLSETAPLIVLGRAVASREAGAGATVWRLRVERVLRGKAPSGEVGLWVPDYAQGVRVKRGVRTLYFLSPVPDLPHFRRVHAAGKGLWRLAEIPSGIAEAALLPAVEALIAARSGGNRDALVAVLLSQAGDPNPRVREDAAADLDRICAAGCPLDAS